MDNTVFDETSRIADTEKKSETPTGLYFAWFSFIAIIFAVIGMKYAEAVGSFDGVSFYGRYEGLEVSGTSGLLIHIRAAVICALPCLMQLLSLYILSASPWLIPAGMVALGFRGFIAGIAYCAVNDTATATQLIVYAVITLAVSYAAAMLVRYGKEMRDKFGKFVGKTTVLTAAAGFAVICELILSYII